MSDSLDAITKDIGSRCLALRARRLNRQLTRLYDEALRPYGLKIAQFTLLVAISELETAPHAALADVLGYEKSSLSRNLSRIEASGWIESGPRPDATRGKAARLTDEGRMLLGAAYPSWKRAQAVAEAAARNAFAGDASRSVDNWARALDDDRNDLD